MQNVLEELRKRSTEEEFSVLVSKLIKDHHTDETESYTNEIKCGGLIFVTDNLFEIFKRLHFVTDKYYSNILS